MEKQKKKIKTTHETSFQSDRRFSGIYLKQFRLNKQANLIFKKIKLMFQLTSECPVDAALLSCVTGSYRSCGLKGILFYTSTPLLTHTCTGHSLKVSTRHGLSLRHPKSLIQNYLNFKKVSKSIDRFLRIFFSKQEIRIISNVHTLLFISSLLQQTFPQN